MSKTYKWLLLALIICITACSNDEKAETVIDDSKQFHGEWFLIDSSGDLVTTIKFEYLYFTGSFYTGMSSSPEVRYTLSGNWAYIVASKVLQMTTTRTWAVSKVKETSSETYVVTKLENNILQLRNQELGSIDTYYKIVEKKTLGIGDSANINLEDANLHISSYNSTSPNIASVSQNGQITANSPGTAFISISTDNGKLIVQIEVL